MLTSRVDTVKTCGLGVTRTVEAESVMNMVLGERVCVTTAPLAVYVMFSPAMLVVMTPELHTVTVRRSEE